jgi:hypothetical protein
MMTCSAGIHAHHLEDCVENHLEVFGVDDPLVVVVVSSLKMVRRGKPQSAYWSRKVSEIWQLVREGLGDWIMESASWNCRRRWIEVAMKAKARSRGWRDARADVKNIYDISR